MTSLKSFLFLCMICASAVAGWAQNREVKFRYNHPYTSGFYISKADVYGDTGFQLSDENPASFILEPVSPGHYLIKMDNKYLYANARQDFGIEFTHDGFDEANGYFGGDVKNSLKLLAVDAVRRDSVLQAGNKQIDLRQINNFVFSFPEYETVNGETAYIISSDIGATASYNPKMSIRDIHHIDIGYAHKVFVSSFVDSCLQPC